MTEPLTILHEDRHLVIVAKPARLLTASDESGDDTLLAQVRRWHAARQATGTKGYLVPVHFLDRPVSGVVMFARSSKAAARLNAAFKSRGIDKIYWAVVEGDIQPGQRVEADDWLRKDPEQNIVRVVPPKSPEAKPCQLSYVCLRRLGPLALLEVRPITGRSHQIRVQTSTRGLPIFGDTKYGASRSWRGGMIALHALRLELTHPVSKEALTVTAPLPQAWRDEFGLS